MQTQTRAHLEQTSPFRLTEVEECVRELHKAGINETFGISERMLDFRDYFGLDSYEPVDPQKFTLWLIASIAQEELIALCNNRSIVMLNNLNYIYLRSVDNSMGGREYAFIESGDGNMITLIEAKDRYTNNIKLIMYEYSLTVEDLPDALLYIIKKEELNIVPKSKEFPNRQTQE